MVRIYALSCGAMEFDRRAFFPDDPAGARLGIPVPAFLLVHPKGRVLFDTGIHCDTLRDPVARLGERTGRFFQMYCGATEGVVNQLGLLGIRADAVTHVVNSHLHFDHCGCNASFPQTTILVQREEMLAAGAAASQYSGRDWDQPLNYELVDGERDLFGDGTLLLIPTPGHTQGHQSLCVNAGRGRRLERRRDEALAGHAARPARAQGNDTDLRSRRRSVGVIARCSRSARVTILRRPGDEVNR